MKIWQLDYCDEFAGTFLVGLWSCMPSVQQIYEATKGELTSIDCDGIILGEWQLISPEAQKYNLHEVSVPKGNF